MSKRFSLLVCYDVETTTPAGEKRLRKMAKACSAYGQRVQYSVFELQVTPELLEKFVFKASEIIDEASDSLRIYRLAGERDAYLRVLGRDRWVDFEAPLVI